MVPKSPPPPPGPRKRLLGSTVDWEPPKPGPNPAGSPAVEGPRPSRDVPTLPQPAAGAGADEPDIDWDFRESDVPALQHLDTRRGLVDERATLPFPDEGKPNPGLGGDTDWERGRGSGGHSLDLSFDAHRASDPGFSLELPDADSSSEALDLVVSRIPASSIAPAEPSRAPDPLAELRERYALGDFSGALTIAEGILEDDTDNADVQRYAESCRDVLMQMYAARLGSMDQIPTVSVPQEQLRWLTLDHRAGFLLSHVDGVSSLEEILDISGMPHLEAMRIIYDLLQQRVIVLQ
ncbi:MAG: hypothetical protein IPJ34_30210 [Myxococcales bacterium]|nr:hypothetical protein [Myxococcales bacterium]